MEPRPQEPFSASRWLLAAALVLLAGLLMGVAGWSLGHGMLAMAGLLVALAGGLGLWHQGARSLRLAQEHQAFLKALNESLDEQVQARTQRLMQTIEDLESFNRMVTHDLKSPLSGLVLGMEMLEAQVEKIQDPELQARVKTLSDCVGRMHDLVQDLRQLALISGRIPVIQEVDLSHHAALVLGNLAQKEPQRRVLWEIEPGLAVYGDPNLIRIALENLLGNAWKYTLDRDPAQIQVRRGQGEGMVIEIQDNGAGFDMSRADRLFQPFQRMHSDARYPGHGIGLSIVKRVMQRHNGQITATSAVDQGATFRLEFPSGLEPKED